MFAVIERTTNRMTSNFDFINIVFRILFRLNRIEKKDFPNIVIPFYPFNDYGFLSRPDFRGYLNQLNQPNLKQAKYHDYCFLFLKICIFTTDKQKPTP